MDSSSPKFCLTWKDYNMIYNREFQDLRKSNDFFDVTLACEDNQVQVHKLVLSAASEFFKQILRRYKHDHPLVYLSGVKYRDLQAILDFIYEGETEVAEVDLESLLSTANNLKIKGLTESQANTDNDSIKSPSLTSDAVEKDELFEVKTESESLSKKTIITPTFGTPSNSRQVKSLHESEAAFSKVTSIQRLIKKPDPMDLSNFLSPQEQEQFAASDVESYSKVPAVVNEPTQGQDYISNKNELERQCNELMVSQYDRTIGKTVWQCAQCHYTSKLRYTVKEHVETHISGFSHQCPYCEKSCNTRNALRVHTIRKHNNKVPVDKEQHIL